MSGHHSENGDPGWFDKKQNINLMLAVLYLACAAVFVAGFFIKNPHPHFEAIERWGVFNAFWGFICFSGIVLLGQHLRKLVMRDEDYYDR
ncbi:MAG: hypothetical protein Tsb0010_00710 [Parvularculaceae bacterium]